MVQWPIEVPRISLLVLVNYIAIFGRVCYVTIY